MHLRSKALLYAGALLASTALAGASSTDANGGDLTFTKDVLPILQANCQVCHRPNGANLGGMVAPMEFTSYDSVRPWAKAIARAVQARDMPPWDAAPSYHGVFSNERTLSQEAIDTLVSWAKAGAPEGRAEDAPPPLDWSTTGDWQIGTPDLIVKMPAPYFVEDDVSDLYVDFATPLTEAMLPTDRWVKAIEFRPGSKVVHHIISQPLGGIAPGNEATVYRDGFATKLRKGSSVSWQMHYHKEPGPGTGVWDQSEVALRFYPEGYQPEHEIHIEPLVNYDFEIPAGDPNYTAEADHTFERDVMILSYTPHMHLRGKSARYVAYFPDSTEETVLDVPKYDFNWQTSYDYTEPKVLPAGTRMHLAMTWDNSPNNPYNPDPTETVHFGQPTTAEMMFGFVSYAYVEEPRKVQVSDALLDSYVGTYGVPNGQGTMPMKIGRLEDTLSITVAGQGTAPLTAISENEFHMDMFKLELKFITNESGEIEIHGDYNGQPWVAPRIEAEPDAPAASDAAETASI